MSPNNEVFQIFPQFYLSLVNFFCIHMFVFLYYAASFLLAIAIVFSQSNLFWDCPNGFVNIFNVRNDLDSTNNFIRFLNLTYSFAEVNIDVSYGGNYNFGELRNKSKPGSDGGNKNAILIFVFLTSSFFHLLIKSKPDGRAKIIQLATFFFTGCSVKHLQRLTPHYDINVCTPSHTFLPLN